MDYNRFVWIAGSGQGDDQLLKSTSDGEFVMQIGRANRSGGNTDTENVNRAADAYVYPTTSEPLVADGYGNRRVIVLDAETGEFRRMWGAFGDPPTDPAEGEVLDPSNPEHFDLVHGVRVSDDDRVYVSDSTGMRLQVVSIEGEYITQLMMGRTEPDPAAIAERGGETAHGRPIGEADRECGCRAPVGKPNGRLPQPGAPLPPRRRTKQPAGLRAREGDAPGSWSFRPGRRPAGGVLHPARHGRGPGREPLHGRDESGARARKFTGTGLAPVGPM